jgi:hypothetical protein
VLSELVGVSGKRAMIVWKSFHEARPSSALAVSLPSLGAIALPGRLLPADVDGERGLLLLRAPAIEARGVPCEEERKMKAEMRSEIAIRIAKRLGAAVMFTDVVAAAMVVAVTV